jgi:penicillin-binding protein 2
MNHRVEQVETSVGDRGARNLSTKRRTGNTVMLSLDIKPQKLVEDMFGDRRGALVALDPRSGDVPFVSKPTFDPNLFVDGLTPKLEGAERVHRQTPSQPNCAAPTRLAYKALRPWPRCKPANAQRTRSSATTLLHFRRPLSQPRRHRLGSVDMYKSIVKSSNVYYYSLANEMGVDMHATS